MEKERETEQRNTYKWKCNYSFKKKKGQISKLEFDIGTWPIQFAYLGLCVCVFF